MPAYVAAGNYTFGRRWERTGVLKPPEWRRRVLAVEGLIRNDKTRFAIFRREVRWYQRGERFLVLIQVFHVVFARQQDSDWSPELTFRVWEGSPLLFGERVRTEGSVVDQLQDVMDVFFTKIFERWDIAVACVRRYYESPVRCCLTIV